MLGTTAFGVTADTVGACVAAPSRPRSLVVGGRPAVGKERHGG
nr:MAG TPA: hypothetical protein [Caudoviricetes sp.]